MGFMIKETYSDDVLIYSIIHIGNVLSWFAFVQFKIFKTIHCVMSDVAKYSIADKFMRKSFAFKLLRKLMNSFGDIHLSVCIFSSGTAIWEMGSQNSFF